MSGFKTRLEKIIQSEHAPFGCKLKKTTLRWIKKEKVRTGKTASEIIEQAIKAYIDSTTAIENGFGDTA